MKKFSFTGFMLLIIMPLVLLTACGDETVAPVTNNSDSCGVWAEANTLVETFGLTRLPSSYLQGNERVFNFYSEVDSICTDQHAVAKYSSTFELGTSIKCYGAVEWSLFYQRVDSGTYINGFRTQWEGVDTIGFKTPFGESAADCFVNVYLRYPTQGSIQADSVYFFQKVHTISYNLKYKYHKPSSRDAGNLINKKNYRELTYIFQNKKHYDELNSVLLQPYENKNNQIIPAGNRLF